MGRLADVRAEIGLALNNVQGIRYHLDKPNPAVMEPGVCWVEWTGMEAEEGYQLGVVSLNTWRVAVVLGPMAFLQPALDRLDTFIDDGLLTALIPVGVVESLTAVAIPTDSGSLAGAEIVLRREY
jgi:hypothetical protein